MKKTLILLLCLELYGCAGWNSYWENVRQNMANNPGYYQQSVTYQQPISQSNSMANPQYYHPDMDCRTYPPGYPIPSVGGMITYPDGTVCVPRGGKVYNRQGSQVGTYKPY